MISANIVQSGFKMPGVENAISTGTTGEAGSVAVEFGSYMDNCSYGSTDSNLPSDETVTVKNTDMQALSPAGEKIRVLFSQKNQNTAGEIPEEVMAEGIGTLAAADAAVQLIQQVMDVIESDTGCSPEELMGILNDIGAEPADLLSEDVVKDVVLKLNGLDSPKEFLTNQEAYVQYTEIMKEVQPLKDDFASMHGFTPEQAADMADTIKQLIPQEINNAVSVQEIMPEGMQPEQAAKSNQPDGQQQSESVKDYTGEYIPESESAEYVADASEPKAGSDITASQIPQNTENSGDIVADRDAGNADPFENAVNAKSSEVIKVSMTSGTEKPAMDESVENAPAITDDEGIVDATETEYIPKEKAEETAEEIDGYGSRQKDMENISNGNEAKENIPSQSEVQSGSVMGRSHGESDSGENRQNGNMKQNAQTYTEHGHAAEKKSVLDMDFTRISNNLFEHIKESVSDVQTAQPQASSFATRIFNQVMEGIKVVSAEEMSSIEMQLQPENLGKLNIQVVSKNGVITAQILTQNEAVKQAIESQMHVLKENMGNQELTIEDVEVTVSSHAFEQGMDNGNHGGSENRQKKRKFVSEDEIQSLNMADIKSIKEELLEEAIKEQNGSTVSYTA